MSTRKKPGIWMFIQVKKLSKKYQSKENRIIGGMGEWKKPTDHEAGPRWDSTD